MSNSIGPQTGICVGKLTAAALILLLLVGCSAGAPRPAPLKSIAAVVAPAPRPKPAPAAEKVPATVGKLPTPGSDPARDQAVTVLMYHHVMPKPDNTIAITPAAFESQMKYLSTKGFHPISMAAMDAFVLRGERLPTKPILITFDDGRVDAFTYAVPILRKYGFTATFFVIGDWVTSHDATCIHLAQINNT